MTLLFCDSFDHYATNDAGKKWDFLNSSTSWFTIQSGGGRNGSNSVRWSSPAFNPAFGKSAANPATAIAGLAISFAAAVTANYDILQFTESGTIQVGVRLTPSGTFIVHRNGTTLATSTATLPGGGFAYLEFKATIHNTAGAYELRLNGTTILSASGVNTRATANAWLDTVWIGPKSGGSGGGNVDFEDFYLCDANGSVNNDFLGDVRIECLYPSGAGASTQLTPSTGANYTCVDEATANTTDYVTSSANDQIDTYAFGDLAESSGSVKAVQVTALAQKTAGATKHLALVDRTNATNHVGADQALATSWLMLKSVLESDAGNGGVAWTIANLNGAEFGVKSRA